jgi:hypothetical protein
MPVAHLGKDLTPGLSSKERGLSTRIRCLTDVIVRRYEEAILILWSQIE